MQLYATKSSDDNIMFWTSCSMAAGQENKETEVETGPWHDGTYLRRCETQKGMKREEVKEVQETGENGDEDGEA